MVTVASTTSPALSQLLMAPLAAVRATEETTGTAPEFTEKVKPGEVPVLPARSVWLAVICLPVPSPMVVRLAAVRV